MIDRRQWRGAVPIGAVSLAVYLLTLAPGLVAIVDTPVFQFVGRVLGVPHNPGYPAYVLITHAFSYLPAGSLAYRMNLFSALSGAAAVAGLYVLCLEVGTRPPAAAAAALGLAFGRVFWSQAVIAEVYTLNAAIVVWMMVLLVGWQRTRRPAHLYAAVALLAVGLGNHTTIVLLVPPMIVLALATDARFALRPRTLAVVAGLAGASLAQYLFILVRSRTPGAYVESPAPTLGALVDVIRGSQFSDGLFAFPIRHVLGQRIPSLLVGTIAPDLTAAGAALAAIGAWRLFRRRWEQAVLFAGGAAMVLAFAVNYDAVDIPVFLIPAILLLWPFVAIGIDAVAGALPGRLAVLAVSTALLAIPGALLVGNFRANDRSHDWLDAAYVDALVRGLPDRTSIVREDFLVDRMVLYELLGAGAARGRDIDLVPSDAATIRRALGEGRTVLAFPRSAERLREAGLDVSYAPRRVLGDPLPAVLSRLPRGMHAVTGATVALDGHDVIDTTEGIATAVLDANGVVTDLFVAEFADGLRVPLHPAALLVYPVGEAHRGRPDFAGLLRRVDGRTDALRMYRDEQTRLVGTGWSEVQTDAAVPYRRIVAPEAALTLPLAPGRHPASVRIVMRAERAGGSLSPSLGGVDLGPRELSGGWQAYDWLVPGGHAGESPATLRLAVSGPGGTVDISSVAIRYGK